MKGILGTAAASAALFFMPLVQVAQAEADRPADFVRDVYPILAANCLGCHGSTMQAGNFRLDSLTHLHDGERYGPAIVPGKPGESILYQAITGEHASLFMPAEGGALSDEDVATVRAWIAQGAEIPDSAVREDGLLKQLHWAYRPVERPEVPEVADATWVRNPIDAFVLAQLEAAGVAPAPEADRPTLIRRLYLDLIGLPPTPEEVDAFVADEDRYAYEKLVTRLLASPHFGERWGRHWLDMARYADSDGYEKDEPRPYAYRYRDWLINAVNQDLPYDRFIIEQIAGDLLDSPTTDQLMATGFHRNTMTNREGGIDPEEDRVKQAVDRTNTTGQVIMGLTMTCAECHTHKYDPISHHEYFGMYAFFNEAKEKDIPAPRPGEMEAYEASKAAFEARVESIERQIREYRPELEARLPEVETLLGEARKAGWQALDPLGHSSEGGAEFEKLDDLSLLLTGESPSLDTYTITAQTEETGIRAIRLQALTHESLTRNGPGRAHNGNFVLSQFTVTAAPLDDPDAAEPVVLVEATADFEEGGNVAANAIDGNDYTGWAIYRGEETNQDRGIVFRPEEAFGFEAGTVLTFTLKHTYGREHNIGRLRLSVTHSDPSAIEIPEAVFAALEVPAEDRTEEQQAIILDYAGQVDPQMKALQTTLATLREAAPEPPATKAMTIAQNPEPPATHVHERGDFLSPGDEVEPHTPAFLHPLKPRGERPDRLDLAHWLVAPENPLTARVAANRTWERLFGAGLTRISEDFGYRGEAPTHPELLDWLADEFRALGWSRKQFIRLLVESATYRQDSTVRPELLDRDPQNRLLARQNRFRVEAEITRDLFLAVSGLLNPAIGGPSIRPPLPEGVANLGYANSIRWPESTGPDKYRRGTYIFFQRMIAYPMLMTFDCPDSNVSALSRSRSNTPLQALTLLNDPVFVEAAQALGQRMLEEGPEEARARLHYAFRLCMGRAPRDRELDALEALLDDLTELYNEQPEEALRFAGDYSTEAEAAPKEAAYMAVARALMNLDEFLTRE